MSKKLKIIKGSEIMNDLGERITYYRKSKGYSIKSLSDNICDESTLYRLEKGKQLPRLEILNEICMKLEIPLKALFSLNEEIEQLKLLCRESTYNEDYLSLEIALDACEQVLEQQNSIYIKNEFSKFISWHKAILLHKHLQNDEAALQILNSIADLKKCGSELDIAILNSVGLIHLPNDLEAANKIYKVIFPKSKKQRFIEDPTLFPRVGYNYAFSLYQLKEYEESLKVALDVLYYMETHHLMYSLGEIYHMIGILLKKNHHLNEAEEYLNNAILVFTLTKDQINLEKANLDLSKLSL